MAFVNYRCVVCDVLLIVNKVFAIIIEFLNILQTFVS